MYVCMYVEEELLGNDSTIRYRQMTKRLVLNYGLVVDKETVRELLKILDPDVVSATPEKAVHNKRSKSPVAYRWL